MQRFLNLIVIIIYIYITFIHILKCIFKHPMTYGRECTLARSHSNEKGGKKSKSGEISSFSTFDFIFAYFSTTLIGSLLFTGAVCRPRFISSGEFYVARLSVVKLVLIDVSFRLFYYWSSQKGEGGWYRLPLRNVLAKANQKNVKQWERSRLVLSVESKISCVTFSLIAALNVIETDVNCVCWEEFLSGKKKCRF